MATSICTALYYRCSTDEQVESIPGQKMLLHRYAGDHKMQIVGEYQDEGRSGDSFYCRTGLQQLLADAKQGKFQALLVRDRSRLSRRNSLRTAKQIIGPLLDAGVAVYTVMNGDLHLDSSTGRIVLAVLSEMDHGENVKKSLNVLNGMLRSATAGSWVGSCPYGYRIVGEKHHKKLVLGGPLEIETVRRMFTLYDQGWACLAIAKLLNAEQVPSPNGRSVWWRTMVTTILRRPVYCGDYVFNQKSRGKYYRLENGQPVPRSGHWRDEDCEQASRTNNTEADWICHRDRWPAIVDRELWDRVQARLDKRRSSKAPVDTFLFSSLLVCDACQQTMWGEMRCGVHRYVCHKCQANVTQSQVLQETAAAIQRAASPEQIAKFKQELYRRLQTPGNGKPINTAAIEKEIKRQERKLVVLDADCVKPVQDEIHRLRRELEQARRAKQAAAVPADLQRRIDQGLQDFFRLPEVLAEKDTMRVRNYLQRTIGAVQLQIATVPHGKGRRYRLLGGKICWQSEGRGPYKPSF